MTHMSVCLPACLPACLSVCLCVCLSVVLSVFLSFCLSVCLSVLFGFLVPDYHLANIFRMLHKRRPIERVFPSLDVVLESSFPPRTKLQPSKNGCSSEVLALVFNHFFYILIKEGFSYGRTSFLSEEYFLVPALNDCQERDMTNLSFVFFNLFFASVLQCPSNVFCPVCDYHAFCSLENICQIFPSYITFT